MKMLGGIRQVKGKIIAIIAIVLFIIFLIIIGVLLRRLDTQIIEEHTFYQYFGGQKITYEGGLKLSRKDDITQIVAKDETVQLDSTPVYYEDTENKAIFPEDMVLVFPNKNGNVYRINHFSKIFFKEDTTYLEGRKNKVLKNAFIYDGQDLYFFLEKTKLKIGEKEYELSPLSYVICDSEGIVEIYQKQEDKYTILDEEQENINIITDEYNINLKTDTIQYADTEQLLIKKKDILKNY